MPTALLPYPTLQQAAVGAASSSAAPASFTANYGGNTTAGTCLLAVACVAASAAPAVSTPANWTPLAALTASNTSIGIFPFLYPNNPGGFTAVAFSTLTNVNGIAVLLWEFQSVQLGAVADPLSSVQAPASGTTLQSNAISPAVGGLLWIAVLASLTGQTLTAANVPTAGIGAWTAGPTATSTLGATNVQAQGFSSLPGPVYPTGGLLQAKGTLGGALQSTALLIGLPGIGAGKLVQSGEITAMLSNSLGSYATGAG